MKIETVVVDGYGAFTVHVYNEPTLLKVEVYGIDCVKVINTIQMKEIPTQQVVIVHDHMTRAVLQQLKDMKIFNQTSDEIVNFANKEWHLVTMTNEIMGWN